MSLIEGCREGCRCGRPIICFIPARETPAALPPSLSAMPGTPTAHVYDSPQSLRMHALLVNTYQRDNSAGLALAANNLDTGCFMLPSASISADHPTGQAPGAGDSGALQRRIGLRSAVLFNMLEMIGVGPFITLPLVIAAAGYRLSVWAWVLGARHRCRRRPGLGRAGRSLSARRWFVCISPRDLRAGGGRELAELSLCLAGLALPRRSRSLRAASASPDFLRSSGLALDAAPNRCATCDPLRQLCCRRRMSSGHCAALSQHQLRGAHGMGAVCRRPRRAHRRHRLRIRARRGHRRLAYARGASALRARANWRFGRPRTGHASRHLLLLGLLQHLFSCRRSPPSRAHHPPRHFALRPLRLRVLYSDESGRAAIAGRRRIARGPVRRPAFPTRRRHRSLRIRTLGRLHHRRAHRVDRLRQLSSRCSSATRACPTPPPATATTSASSPLCTRSTAFLTARLSRLALVGAFFCFFSLTQVITLLVITRILLQFFLQQFGVIYLRVRKPDLPRPFRMPLYPLPPLFAMAGFGFLLVYRVHAVKELAVAAGIAVSGTVLYLFRAHRLRQWPFAGERRNPHRGLKRLAAALAGPHHVAAPDISGIPLPSPFSCLHLGGMAERTLCGRPAGPRHIPVGDSGVEDSVVVPRALAGLDSQRLPTSATKGGR